jgi:hypothetical protein
VHETNPCNRGAVNVFLKKTGEEQLIKGCLSLSYHEYVGSDLP